MRRRDPLHSRSIRTRLFLAIFAAIILPPLILVGALVVLLAGPDTFSQSQKTPPGDSFVSGHRITAGSWRGGMSWGATVTEENNSFIPSPEVVSSLARQESRVPQKGYRAMVDVLRGEANQDWIDVGSYEWRGQYSESKPGGMPAAMAHDVATKGWAVGTATNHNGSGTYASWRAGRTTAFYIYRAVSKESTASSGWLSRNYPILVQLAIWLGVFALSALIAAQALSRRIARPVSRVALASLQLADGEAPAPLQVTGPQEIAALSYSFNEMSERLSQARENEQSFFLSVSHELKTPLTAIRGYGETLVEGRGDPHVAGEVITEEAGRLQRLVQDVLDLGRARTTAFSVRREPVDLALVAQTVKARYESTARVCGVDLKANTPNSVPVVADTDRVIQVVSNLVENALRSTPAGGLVIISAAGSEVSVSDTGRGLAKDDLGKAFDRFYLYERAAREHQVGTGLGLAIVKELTEAMSGSVSVVSELGRGSVFSIRLTPAESPQEGDCSNG